MPRTVVASATHPPPVHWPPCTAWPSSCSARTAAVGATRDDVNRSASTVIQALLCAWLHKRLDHQSAFPCLSHARSLRTPLLHATSDTSPCSPFPLPCLFEVAQAAQRHPLSTLTQTCRHSGNGAFRSPLEDLCRILALCKMLGSNAVAVKKLLTK